MAAAGNINPTDPAIAASAGSASAALLFSHGDACLIASGGKVPSSLML
jgi:hypothetical protein